MVLAILTSPDHMLLVGQLPELVASVQVFTLLNNL